jgi:hypothetical protein
MLCFLFSIRLFECLRLLFGCSLVVLVRSLHYISTRYLLRPHYDNTTVISVQRSGERHQKTGDRTQEIKRKRPEQNNGCPNANVERSGERRQKSRFRPVATLLPSLARPLYISVRATVVLLRAFSFYFFRPVATLLPSLARPLARKK